MSKRRAPSRKSDEEIIEIKDMHETNKRKRLKTFIITSSDSSSESEECVLKSRNKQSPKKRSSSKTSQRKRVKKESNDFNDDVLESAIQTKPVSELENQKANKIPSKTRGKRIKKELNDSDYKSPQSKSSKKENNTIKTKKSIEVKFKDEKPNSKILKSLISSNIDSNNPLDMDWTEGQYISEMHNINENISCNVIKLFEQENTIPFIARYRKSMTGGMEAEILRAVKESYDRAKQFKQRASTVIKSIDKLGKWTPSIHALVKSAKSLNTLDYISSLFKVPGKRSLSERAKQLGLGEISENVLNGQSLCSLSSFIQPSKEGLKNLKEIEDGIIHILADVISKNKSLFDKIQELRKNTIAVIQVSQRKSTATETKISKIKNEGKMKEHEDKYENYYNFKSRSDIIKPHQILAINRGENHKVLSVKLIIPNSFEYALRCEFQNIYKKSLQVSQMHNNLLMKSFDYAFKKSIEPALIRRIRNELNEQAESASIEVFAMNLKQLLLAVPLRGQTILGIDPGFYHGCKLAVVSENGNVLATNVIYIHQNMKNNSVKTENASRILVELVKEYNCSTIALGNGTACRETEVFLADLIKSGAFHPLDISYTIVDECGASIYSCSEEAKKEFPKMDCNLISAISIARRLQDPLAELVKIEPKHLGVGMYQHDLPEKQLDATLNEVIIEAVSFVGVDINTVSLCLLKRIAGLNIARAKAIIDWRTKNGSFTNRKQLLDVKGIGNKSFEQCAGFIRILPETAVTSQKTCTVSFNYLDQTWIHPESYEITNKIIKDAGCNVNNLGTDAFIEGIKRYTQLDNATLAKRFGTEESTIEIIIKGLITKKDYDIRLKYDKPLFRKSLKGIEDLEVGIVMRGQVRNVTHFGAFVDVGISRNALIPLRFMKCHTLGVGQRVQVKIKSIEKERGRVCLELMEAY